MVKVNEIESYKSYGKCVSISNGVIEAYVTVDIGPRIIKFGYIDGQNILCNNREKLGFMTDKKYTDFFGADKKWESFGGHRMWLSPESYPETYYPDDSSVSYIKTESGAKFTPVPEKEVGIALTLEIKMDPDDTNMMVIMGSKNVSNENKKYSIWGITVAAEKGSLIIPMNTNDTELLSNRIVSVWPYTDMSDKRIYWGNKYVTLSQDVKAKKPIKIGFDLNCGTVYYLLNDDIFCKKFNTYHPDSEYPDGGCSFETYTNNCMIEIESLGELKTLKPGETSEHIESWSLFKKPVDVDFKNEKSIDNLFDII